MIENIEMLPETKKDLKRIALEKKYYYERAYNPSGFRSY